MYHTDYKIVLRSSHICYVENAKFDVENTKNRSFIKCLHFIEAHFWKGKGGCLVLSVQGPVKIRCS